MGRDKALLHIDGMPFLTRTCKLAQTVAQQVYVVTPWIERYSAIAPEPCQLIREIWPEQTLKSPGPLWGFAQTLPLVQTEWILLLACDLPYLTADFLQKSVEQLNQIPTDKQAFLADSDQGWEPLCGFYRRYCSSSLNLFLEQGGSSFQKWLNNIQVEKIILENNQILFNCNTPQEFIKLNQTNQINQIP